MSRSNSIESSVCCERHILPSVEQTLAQIGGAGTSQSLMLLQGSGR